MLTHAPQLEPGHATRLAKAVFDIDGTASPLPSERDQNFLIEGDRPIILKIANAQEERGVIEAQQRAMQHLERSFPLAPKIVCVKNGDLIAAAKAPDGKRHMVWAVSRLDGIPLGDVHRRSAGLARNFGATIGKLANAFQGFDDPALHRTFYWDLAHGRDIVATYRELIDDPALGATIDSLLERYDRHTAPVLADLPTSAIHNDLNDFNILVGGGTDLYDRNQHVTGVVDFGDVVHGYTIGDLSIAIAYMVLDAPDPLTIVSQMVHGYHLEREISEVEMRAVWGLAMLRLCMSACIAAHQQQERPDNKYLGVSQAPLRRTLPRLAKIPFAFAEGTVRDACGIEPMATSARVRKWLASNTRTFAPILGIDLRTEPTLVLDLSAGSPLVSGNMRLNQEPALTTRVFGAMQDARVQVAVGRYDEARLLYVAPFFDAGDGTVSEHRSIHIGLDLFAVEGTPVYAPMDGVVHAFGEYLTTQDYGHSIVLRHATDDGTEFFTLYGHLSTESLKGLEVGRAVKRGERFAWLGDEKENVGWTPHLHLQVITDMLDSDAGFAGVGTASRRAVWKSVCPDPNLIVGVPENRFPRPSPGTREILERRRAHIGGNVSIAYREPVRTVRGWMQYLYDSNGRRYIDAYNNVPHVGHSHPRVVDAVAKQMSVLSTNTRYLNDGLTEFAERLSATMPAPLSVCYFVNSASEANELALRLARTCTKHRDVIVLEGAYHGHTTSLIDVSPYKHAGPGGNGPPDWVRVASLPDDYRGPYKRSSPDCGACYAADVGTVSAAIRAEGKNVAAFIAETCPSVGGQLMLPDGYLRAVYETVRADGGLCIADEVQTGLGRMGTHFWAFEMHKVVPDIVVVGKPLGNGHPVAAVVTTRAIADAFDNGMEFFSTFGGNNVSCAAGLAVLDELRDGSLQLHARQIGDRMLSALRSMQSRHELIGDVRGSGLFLGVELVSDHGTLDPAAAEASYVANRMREEGILLGTDGPHHNVVKIRPPMPFDTADADQLVETFDRVLSELR